ncbi:MAG: glycosyl hydrolase [Candidatus Aminicenantes bacterium]|nr:glycosyl hydrolase [Candidatus Aminicenantes bacterium]
MKKLFSMVFILVLCVSLSIAGINTQKNEQDTSLINAATLSGLKFRSIGPAFTSGRIADFAFNPKNPKEYYVGVASGHIWKTVNNGITWTPLFDNYGSYAIGCLAMDPNNPNVVWAGTGENNSQRALGYGDGVYKTENGGKTWKNMGLKKSRQIGKILIDPRDSDVVYVAAEGSVWGPGGDRGLYKTTDGGQTWEAVLTISEHTGVSDMVMDPRYPDIIYAASHQRRRHVFTKIDGGPETDIYKTIDSGKTWKKLTTGLPSGDMGAMGLAISPVNPDVVYAIIELPEGQGGFYRTTDRGASWEKMSAHVSNSPQYYNEIFADPKDVNKVYSVETITQFTEDGGKTWQRLGNKYRHVDDHALWIDPKDTEHLIIGGDGGIYETFDSGQEWLFKCNLPVTQFYRVAVDRSFPFYFVYGGTQDNNSMGGPSRTLSSYGITNEDWFITNGGDGFWSAIDPENPHIVYAESQYGGLVRYDKKSGEQISIKPQPPSGEAYRWNWNAPLIISPHSHKRLYFGANKLFRSDDYGNTWTVLGGDLTRQIDRNQLKVMGRIWPPEAVAKNASTSLYGTIVSLDESPVREDLMYLGTDDGLIQRTEDGGKSWTKMEKFPGVPLYTYVSDILASKHNENVVFACFDNRKRDDFKPYLLKSTDKGETWTSLSSNLPENGTVHTLEQDHINPDLLFAGTEFGAFTSLDGGKYWVPLKSGIPTISVRDMTIQKREDDLVLATFGRGFYILDNYAPLRIMDQETLKKEAFIFPIKDALMFIQTGVKYGQGSTYFAGENPALGAVFTYYLKESIKTKKQERKAKEKQRREEGKPIQYPTFDQLREEDQEENPYLLFTITDSEGNEVRKIKAPPRKGIHRITWDFRYPSTDPPRSASPIYGSGGGMLALPGEYTVSLGKWVNGDFTELAGPQSFQAVPLENTSLPAEDREALFQFQKKVAELNRAVMGASQYLSDVSDRIDRIKVAISNTPDAPRELMKQARAIEDHLQKIRMAFYGDPSISRRSGNQPPSIVRRVRSVVYSHWSSTSAPTQTMKTQYQIAGQEFETQAAQLRDLVENRIQPLEKAMRDAGAPWTPGRFPVWKK